MNSAPHIETLSSRGLRTCCWNRHLIGTTTPLLIFNGVGMNFEVLEPMIRQLGNRPVLTLDVPGIGGSPDPTMPYTPQMAASWGSKLLERYGVSQADVMGFSWGGAVAQQFAIQHRNLVRRLVLAAIGPGLPILPGKATYHFHLLDPIWQGQTKDSNLLGAICEADREVVFNDLQKTLTLPTSRGYFFQILALSGWASALALPLINKPSLILMGDEDHIVPMVNGRWLSALIPGSKLETIKGGGHLFMFSHVREVAEPLRAFLETDEQEQRGAA